MAFDFLGRVEALNPTNLTIRERARLAENPLDLRYRAIFPRTPVGSTKISEIVEAEYRMGGGRREWNAQGREIPTLLGPVIEAQMVPINPTKHLDELYLQRLRERAGGFGQLINQGIITDVDGWATRLADTTDVQLEIEGFEAWFTNQITVMDPKTGETHTVSTGVSTDRYVQASDTLADETDAYAAFAGYLRDARSKLGSVGAARMRQSLLTEILADAPDNVLSTIAYNGANAMTMTVIGYGTVQIIIDERTYQKWTDGGSATTDAYYVPDDRIAFQPAGGVVGRTYVAPVGRAYDYVDMEKVGTANGVSVFYSPKNDGKTLLVEAQENSLVLPLEQSTYVVYDL